MSTSATPGREQAIAWLRANFQLGVVSSLPRDGHGKIIWALAGPMMDRELPAIKFAVIYLTGMGSEESEMMAKMILNEWHGLDRYAGIDAEYGPQDLKGDDYGNDPHA